MSLKRLNQRLDDFFLLNKNRAFPEFDGMRACAILMVFMSHAGSWLNNILADSQKISPLSQHIYDFVRLFPLFGSEGGGVGVDIFFMLSGFLIFMTINKSNPSMMTFIKNRLMRLLPVHALLILALATSHGLTTVALNLSMLVDFFPHYENINLISWTLSYELLFYILAALWFIMFRKSAFAKSWVFLVLITVLLLESQWLLAEPLSRIQIKYPDMNRFIAFIFGVALAKLYFESSSLWRLYGKYIKLGVIPTVLLLIAIRYQYNVIFTQHIFGLFWKNIISICLDVSLFVIFANLLLQDDSKIKRILRNRYVRIVGVISYSMYLYHFAFALPMTKNLLSSISNISLKMLLFIPMSLCISLAVSVFLFHFLEKPYFLRKRNKGS